MGDVVAEKQARRKVAAQSPWFAAQPLVIVEAAGERTAANVRAIAAFALSNEPWWRRIAPTTERSDALSPTTR